MPAPKAPKAPSAPAHLQRAGRAVWRAIVTKYDLRPDEMFTLEDACRITDVIAALTAAWAETGSPMTTTGSMGQLVIHPLIGEIRQQRMSRNTLWRQMKLPDIDGGGIEANQNREAANASWQPGVRSRGGGA